MRLDQSVRISAPPQTVWDYLSDPENYLRFMSGLTRWEVIGDKANGLGARYRILIRVGAADVGGQIEMVEWNEPFDQAWHSVTGVDQRGRWRIREAGKGHSKVEFRFAYGVIGGGIAGLISEFASAPAMRRHMRRTLGQLKRQVEHEQRRADAERRRAQRETSAA
jgi:carbon monoxide dehydrogenase subunit G